MCVCDLGVLLSTYPASHPGPNYKSGLTWTGATRRTQGRTEMWKLWLNQACLTHICGSVYTPDRLSLVSSLCVDRFVGLLQRIQVYGSKKQGFLVD